MSSCTQPYAYVADATDCDDAEPSVYTGADELCDSLDNDCDEAVDEDPSFGTLWYADADGDGFGDANDTEQACDAPGGDVGDGSDCDDADESRFTDADGDGACDPAAADYTTVWGSGMIAVVGGTFTMGGGKGDPSDGYQDHEVTLTRDFWIGRSEVTAAQWAAWSGLHPAYHGSCDDCPVEQVSWEDAAMYANALSAAEGLTACYLADGSDLDSAYLADPSSCDGYRLPTEAEWEYAAKSTVDAEFSGSDDSDEVAWTSNNAAGETHEVCGLATNAWGLCDMSGNVWEWTGDWYGQLYGGYGDGLLSLDPAGESTGTIRVIRGGAWFYSESYARVCVRGNTVTPVSRFNVIGVRLARAIPR